MLNEFESLCFESKRFTEDSPLKQFIGSEEALDLKSAAEDYYEWMETDEEAKKVSSSEEVAIRKKYLEGIIAKTKSRREFFEESPVVFQKAVLIKDIPEWIKIANEC